MARSHRRRHRAAAPPPEPYTEETRQRNAAKVASIQKSWSMMSPEAPRPLHDPGLSLSVFGNESDMGRLFRARGSSYVGWFQLSTNPNKDTFGNPKVLYAVADKLNAIGKVDPEAMKVAGKTLDMWTPQLVKQHFARNPYIQTVGFLECAQYHNKMLGLHLENFPPDKAAALAYMAHVVPAVAKNIAEHPNSPESLALLSNKDLRNYMRRNPSVFDQKLTPSAAMDRWVNNRYKPTQQEFGSLIEQTKKEIQEASDRAGKKMKELALQNDQNNPNRKPSTIGANWLHDLLPSWLGGSPSSETRAREMDVAKTDATTKMAAAKSAAPVNGGGVKVTSAAPLPAAKAPATSQAVQNAPKPAASEVKQGSGLPPRSLSLSRNLSPQRPS